MKLDETEEAEGLPACCFRRSVAVQNLDVRHPPRAGNAFSSPHCNHLYLSADCSSLNN